jgi:hypothetical protein
MLPATAWAVRTAIENAGPVFIDEEEGATGAWHPPQEFYKLFLKYRKNSRQGSTVCKTIYAAA